MAQYIGKITIENTVRIEPEWRNSAGSEGMRKKPLEVWIHAYSLTCVIKNILNQLFLIHN